MRLLCLLAGDLELASGSAPAPESPRKPTGPPPVLVVQPDGVQVSAACKRNIDENLCFPLLAVLSVSGRRLSLSRLA